MRCSDARRCRRRRRRRRRSRRAASSRRQPIDSLVVAGPSSSRRIARNFSSSAAMVVGRRQFALVSVSGERSGLSCHVAVVALLERADQLRELGVALDLLVDLGEEVARLLRAAGRSGRCRPVAATDALERCDRRERELGVGQVVRNEQDETRDRCPSSAAGTRAGAARSRAPGCVGFQTDIVSISSARLPLTVTLIGRVWGTGIGMACTQVCRLDLNSSMNSRTAAVNRSHWKSGSYPVSSRKGWPISSCAR